MSRRKPAQPQPPFLSTPFFLFSLFLLLLPLQLILLCLDTECFSPAQTHYPAQTSLPPCQTRWASEGNSAGPGNKTSGALGLPGLVGGHDGPRLLSQVLLWFSAPRRDGTQASGPEASSQLFIDRPDFFDYPDSDQASLLAVAEFIGERPVLYAKTGMNRLGRGAALPAGSGKRLLLTVWQVPALGSSSTSWWGRWWWPSSSCFSSSARMCEFCLHVRALPLPGDPSLLGVPPHLISTLLRSFQKGA